MTYERISCPNCDRTFGQETRFLSHLTNDHAVEDPFKLYLDTHCGGVQPTCQCSSDCQEKLTWAGWRRGFLTNRARGHASRPKPSSTPRRRGRSPDPSESRTSVAVKLAQSLRAARSSTGRRFPNPAEVLAAARTSRASHDGKTDLIDSSSWPSRPLSTAEDLSVAPDSITTLASVDDFVSPSPVDVATGAAQPSTKSRRRKSSPR